MLENVIRKLKLASVVERLGTQLEIVQNLDAPGTMGWMRVKKKRQKVKGRVFAIIKKDVKASNGVTTCTLSLFGTRAKTLFDTGVTYSFVSLGFTRYSNKPP